MTVPTTLLKKSFHVWMVVFMALFSFVFIAVYRPFHDTMWLGLVPLRNFMYTLAFYIVCITAVLSTMSFLYNTRPERPLTMKKVFIWLFSEYLFVALVYVLFTYLFNLGDFRFSIQYIVDTVLCVGLVLGLPFAICMMYAVILDNREEIRLLRLNQVNATRNIEVKMVNFHDHSGVLKISVAEDDIYYIDSQDNYVNIHYILDGSLSTYLLRNSTTQIESILKDTSVIRCHRSYMANLNRAKMLTHSKGKAEIILSDESETHIPVSRSYYKQVLEVILPEKVIKST